MFQDEVFFTLESISGDGEEYFLLEERTGVIRLKKPLKDAANEFRMVIMANDGRGKSSNASVTIRISRDEQPPTWSNLPYTPGQVSENARNGSGVYTIKAQDPDQRVS